jgi:hypothetical protein
MTVLPGMMLWHVFFAECLVTILALGVLRCYPSAFNTFFQSIRPAEPKSSNAERWFKLEPERPGVLGSCSTLESFLGRSLPSCWPGSI